MIKLSLERVEHGWANIEMIFNNQVLVCEFEYTPNDALNDLLYSAICVTQGRDAIVVFPCHSHRTELTVISIGSNMCRIMVEGFIMELSTKDYAKVVLRMFDKYLYSFSERKYEIEWRRSFPSDYLSKLRQQYHSL